MKYENILHIFQVSNEKLGRIFSQVKKLNDVVVQPQTAQPHEWFSSLVFDVGWQWFEIYSKITLW